MTSFLYNAGKIALLSGGVNLVNDAIKVALFTSGYVPDKDSDENFDDVTNEVSGSGYTAGGKTLTGASTEQDDDNDRAILRADNLSWPVATFTARAAVIYKDTGSAATSLLVAYVDFGDDQSVSGEDFTLEWHQDGVLYLGE